MRSQSDLAARVLALWDRVSPTNPQPLSALETFEVMAELRALTWALETPLDAVLSASLGALEPAAAASPRAIPAIPDEITPASEADVERYATLVTAPALRTFGHPRLLLLGLPPVQDALWPRATASVQITRLQAEQLTQLSVPDPWASGDPAASTRAPASPRKVAS